MSGIYETHLITLKLAAVAPEAWRGYNADGTFEDRAVVMDEEGAIVAVRRYFAALEAEREAGR